jgi:hypothetical protein
MLDQHAAGAVPLTDPQGFNSAVAELPMIDRGGVVPYAVLWSGEHVEETPVIERRGLVGVSFADESVVDRDRGVLWERAAWGPGQGRPDFGKLHPLRQRRAMHRLLCQVCAQPADADEGALWLLAEDQVTARGWPRSVDTAHPPLCPPCALASTRVCPWLRNGYLAARARSRVCGVFGTRYRIGIRGLVAIDDAFVSFNDPAIRWTVATQLARTLRDCTVVDLG